MMSMIAVSIIIYRVVAMKKSSRRVYDRLLLGMSVMNFFGSFAFFLGTWTYSNAGFCTLQGWLLQINSAVFWYNGVLATNFLLRIVFEWKEHDTEMIEPYLHAIAWTFPVMCVRGRALRRARELTRQNLVCVPGLGHVQPRRALVLDRESAL
jgi:hypothetical protein